MRLIHLFADGILADTLILFPIIVFLGALLAKRTVAMALAAAATVLLGWLMILVGLQVVVNALGSLDALLNPLYATVGKTQRVVLDPLLTVKGRYLHAQSFTVLFAYVINILWARLSPARYVFLNPIHVLLASALLLIMFLRAGASVWVAVPVTAALIGSAMAWLPYLANRPFELMGTSSGVTLGSFHTGILIGVAFVAPRLGQPNAKKGKEILEEPDGRSLASPIVVSGMVVGLVALLLALNAGEVKATAALKGMLIFELLPTIGSATHVVAALWLGFAFAAGIWVILRALPFVVRSVEQAFEGWQRLLPECRPAMDAIFMLGEAPRFGVIGFLMSLAGGILAFFLCGWMGLKAFPPGMVVAVTAGHLVGGAAAATVAARFGGPRAMWALAPAHGFLLAFFAILTRTASAGLSKGSAGVAVELSDLSLVGSLIGFFLRLVT